MAGRRLGWLILLATALGSAGNCHAQRAPEAGHIFPPVGQAGTTVEIRLAATDLTPDSRFFFMDPRLKLEVLEAPGPVLMPEPPYWLGIKAYLNDPNLTREVRAKLTIPADMPPGLVHWGVANASGAGDTGKFLVSDRPFVLEEDGRKGPQVLPPLPVQLCGRLGRIEEVDQYLVEAKRDGMMTCELVARRLGADCFGVLRVSDEGGNVLTEHSDTAGLDPVVSFPARKGKKYTIAVHDVDHKGYRSLGYQLRVTDGPRIVSASPSGGKRGERREVTFWGIGLATGGTGMESLRRAVEFPAKGDRFSYRLETPQGASVPYFFSLGDTPEQLIQGPNVTPIGAPGNWTGGLEAGIRRFSWKARKGDGLRLAAHALNPHGGQDLELEVLGADGKKLVDADDNGGTANPVLPFTAPADGEYQVVLRDRNGMEPGPADLFRLTARGVGPDFRLEIPATLSFPAGGTGAMTVKVVRQQGFKEPVTVSLENLPQGVTAPEAAKRVVAGNADSLKVDLVTAKNAPVDARLVRVTGQAKVDGKNLDRVAVAMQGQDWDPWRLESAPLDQVLVATTLKPPFKVKPLEADGGRRVNRGATHLAELSVERDKDFNGQIVLDMAARQQRHRQGIRGPMLTVEPGAKRAHYPVFLPEGLETSRTSRIGLVGMARVKDPSGVERWVTGDVEGQITMSIEGALLKLTAPGEVELGKDRSAVVPVQLLRSASLREPVVLELVVPAECGGVLTAERLVLPEGRHGPVEWRLSAKGGLQPGVYQVTARASCSRDGHPVVSETVMAVVCEGGK